MTYVTVGDIAQRWNLSERTIRNYCACGRIPGAVLTGKTWQIPEDAQRPERINKRSIAPHNLLEALRREKAAHIKGGIYHKLQIELTYNSNHIEGNRLSHDQTYFIFETNMVGIENDPLNVDDILETVNHFRCIDLVIAQANRPLSEAFIKVLHRTLKAGTGDSRKDWFAVSDYKRVPNEVGGHETVAPENVSDRMVELLEGYRGIAAPTFDDLLAFHYAFESIHPFQDGNGRIGRLILLKECLRTNIVPFIIDEQLKWFYYRGLREWETERGYLRDTCLTAQDSFKAYLDYFRIPYED